MPQKPEQMDGKRFNYISAISSLKVWGALGEGYSLAVLLVQQRDLVETTTGEEDLLHTACLVEDACLVGGTILARP